VHAVCETSIYLADAKAARLSADEMVAIVDFIAANPTAGDEIRGTGGCRKVRFAGRGKGKSGGYRVVTFYTGANLPVFLLAVYGKNERADISQATRNAMQKATKTLVETYRRR
jgi:hypothetical protein